MISFFSSAVNFQDIHVVTMQNVGIISHLIQATPNLIAQMNKTYGYYGSRTLKGVLEHFHAIIGESNEIGSVFLLFNTLCHAFKVN